MAINAAFVEDEFSGASPSGGVPDLGDIQGIGIDILHERLIQVISGEHGDSTIAVRHHERSRLGRAQGSVAGSHQVGALLASPNHRPSVTPATDH